MDHIVALKHGGQTTLENLALSCAICNQHKGSDIASVDPATGDVVPLFHPRRDSWEEHFELTQDGVVVSRTAVARGTARLLRINHPDRVTERKLLLAVGDF
jgi:5-methylcytosine-specific restriction endonuclease McrA